jgi:hypothetical protein
MTLATTDSSNNAVSAERKKAESSSSSSAVGSAKGWRATSASSSSSSTADKARVLATLAAKLDIFDCSLDAVLDAVGLLQTANDQQAQAFSAKLRDGLLKLSDMHGLRTTLLDTVSCTHNCCLDVCWCSTCILCCSFVYDCIA